MALLVLPIHQYHLNFPLQIIELPRSAMILEAMKSKKEFQAIMTQSLISIPQDFYQQIQSQATGFAIGITKMTAEMVWLSIRAYWPYLVIGLLILLIWRTIEAMRGEWDPLGSLLYHIIYFGFWAGIVAIMGWEILLNPLLDLIILIFYRIAYWLVGLILKDFIKRRNLLY